MVADPDMTMCDLSAISDFYDKNVQPRRRANGEGPSIATMNITRLKKRDS